MDFLCGGTKKLKRSAGFRRMTPSHHICQMSYSYVTEDIQSFRKVAEDCETKSKTLDKLSFDAKHTAHPCKSTAVTADICGLVCEISGGLSESLYDLKRLVEDAIGEREPRPTAPLTVRRQHKALVAIEAHINNILHASFHQDYVTMTARSAAQRANGECVEIDDKYILESTEHQGSPPIDAQQ